MKDPKIKTTVVHSQSKSAWNVVGTTLGAKYKICSVPYVISEDEQVSLMQTSEALEHALFISSCFNNSSIILAFINSKIQRSQEIC